MLTKSSSLDRWIFGCSFVGYQYIREMLYSGFLHIPNPNIWKLLGVLSYDFKSMCPITSNFAHAPQHCSQGMCKSLLSNHFYIIGYEITYFCKLWREILPTFVEGAPATPWKQHTSLHDTRLIRRNIKRPQHLFKHNFPRKFLVISKTRF